MPVLVRTTSSPYILQKSSGTIQRYLEPAALPVPRKANELWRASLGPWPACYIATPTTSGAEQSIEPSSSRHCSERSEYIHPRTICTSSPLCSLLTTKATVQGQVPSRGCGTHLRVRFRFPQPRPERCVVDRDIFPAELLQDLPELNL